MLHARIVTGYLNLLVTSPGHYFLRAAYNNMAIMKPRGTKIIFSYFPSTELVFPWFDTTKCCETFLYFVAIFMFLFLSLFLFFQDQQQCSYEVAYGDLEMPCRRMPGETCKFTCHEDYIPSTAVPSREITCGPFHNWSLPLSSLCKSKCFAVTQSWTAVLRNIGVTRY